MTKEIRELTEQINTLASEIETTPEVLDKTYYDMYANDEVYRQDQMKHRKALQYKKIELLALFQKGCDIAIKSLNLNN